MPSPQDVVLLGPCMPAVTQTFPAPRKEELYYYGETNFYNDINVFLPELAFRILLARLFILTTLFIIFKQDGRNKSLQINKVLIKIPSIFIFPNTTFQVIFPRFPGCEDIDSRSMLYNKVQDIKSLQSLHDKHDKILRHAQGLMNESGLF